MTSFSDVECIIKEAGGAVWGYEDEPSVGQFAFFLCHPPHRLAWNSLPHGGSDPLQVTDVVLPRYGTHGVS